MNHTLPHTSKPSDGLWTQRDGSKIAVSAMTEAHAKNALRMVLRMQDRRQRADKVNFLCRLLDRKALDERLIEAFLDETESLFDETVYPRQEHT